MKVEEKKVYSFKLLTGDELVAHVISVNADSYEVEKPVLVLMTQEGLQFVPALLTADMEGNQLLPKSAIALIGPPREDVDSMHLTARSGIQTPSKQILT